MPLDPEARAYLDQMEATGAPPITEMTPTQARDHFRSLIPSLGEKESIAGVEDRTFPGPGGEVPVRVYTPEGRSPFPALVYYHGGGWVIGDIESHDGLCRSLAHAAGCAVVSVDYRLAPEHKYPAAAEDSLAAARWVSENAASLGVDAGRIAVGGDSAGGNLAAVVALMARERGGPALAFQLLVYPVTDRSFETASYRENADGYLLTRDRMAWFWNQYLSRPEQGKEPFASPAQAPDLSGLPSALVITAEYDPLRDEGEAYAARLKEAGVKTTLARYDGMIHGFLRLSHHMRQARQAVDVTASALRQALSGA